jgi:small subunit ribosomal protein S3
MGQKVNPHGMRVGVIKDWDSRWFAGKSNFGDQLVEDYNLRKTLKKQLYAAGVPKIEIERIEREDSKVKINIHCAKPGLVIGKQGSEIEKLRKQCEAMLGKTVNINVVEVKTPDLNAQLVAENIAAQLENRISFRRAMKQSIGRAMKFGAKGIKIMCSGRLGGAEIARSETYHEGTIPLQTLRADIDYGFAEAATTYGRIGVKVWLYRGEVLNVNTNENNRRSRKPRKEGGNK